MGDTCLGKAACLIQSHFLRRESREGKQTGYASKVKGRTLCYPALPRPVYTVPTQAGVKAAH